MLYDNFVVRAKFIKRPNRFIAHVKLNNEEVIVHVPNTGRCKEILITGSTVILKKSDKKNRKTEYDLIAAYKDDKLINIDSQVPNHVVEEALKSTAIHELKRYSKIEREKKYGNSRLDFKLSDECGKEYYLEVKGVTFENKGICMFPDAPTTRGKKHILELISAKEQGKGAGILFLIQLEDVKYFSPFYERDQEFSNTLLMAKKKGVDILVYNCKVGENYIKLDKSISYRV